MCILSVVVTRPGCLVWDENTVFEVMHMWCDSLYLCAVFSCPSRFSRKCCLLQQSIVGKLCMGCPLLSRSSFFWLSSRWIPGGWRESTRGHLAFVGAWRTECWWRVACWEDATTSFKSKQWVKCWVMKGVWWHQGEWINNVNPAWVYCLYTMRCLNKYKSFLSSCLEMILWFCRMNKWAVWCLKEGADWANNCEALWQMAE